MYGNALEWRCYMFSAWTRRRYMAWWLSRLTLLWKLNMHCLAPTTLWQCALRNFSQLDIYVFWVCASISHFLYFMRCNFTMQHISKRTTHSGNMKAYSIQHQSEIFSRFIIKLFFRWWCLIVDSHWVIRDCKIIAYFRDWLEEVHITACIESRWQQPKNFVIKFFNLSLSPSRVGEKLSRMDGGCNLLFMGKSTWMSWL